VARGAHALFSAAAEVRGVGPGSTVGVLVRTPCKLHATPARVRTQTVLPPREERSAPRDYSCRARQRLVVAKRQQLTATDESKKQAPQVKRPLQPVNTRHSSFLPLLGAAHSSHTRSAAERRVTGETALYCVRRRRMCVRRHRMASGKTLPPSRRTASAWLPTTQCRRARRPLRCRRHSPPATPDRLPTLAAHPRMALCPCL